MTAGGAPRAELAAGERMLAAARCDAAERQFARILVRAPRSLAALRGRGAALIQLGRLAEALDTLQLALQQEPADPAANLAFGQLCVRLQEPALAIEHLLRVLRAVPDSAAARSALAHALAGLGRAADGKALMAELVAAHPDSTVGWLSLGILAEQLGDHDAARAAYEQLLGCAPLHAGAHYHRAFLRLRDGEFDAGWSDYEQRFAAGAVARPAATSARWRGQPVAHLLVLAEQGLGDVLQCARFVPLLRERARRVTLQADATLATLLARSLGIEVCTPGAAPAHDAHVELMSLPHLLALGERCIDVPAAYLRAAPAPGGAFAAAAGDGAPAAVRRIGLAWAASPGHATEATPYARRSCPAAALAPLLAVPGCRFVSLQVGPQAGQLAAALAVDPHAPAPPFDAAPLIRDMDDTAALVAQLDAVVTVDTSIAHLAGALGVPALLLLPYSANWQWMHGPATGWYPRARLFRQDEPGDWREPVRRVAAALAAGCPARTAPDSVVAAPAGRALSEWHAV